MKDLKWLLRIPGQLQCDMCREPLLRWQRTRYCTSCLEATLVELLGPRIEQQRRRLEALAREVPLEQLPRPLQVASLLRARSPEPVSTRELCERIWGEYTPATAAALRQCVYTLRHQHQERYLAPDELVVHEGRGYALLRLGKHI